METRTAYDAIKPNFYTISPNMVTTISKLFLNLPESISVVFGRIVEVLSDEVVVFWWLTMESVPFNPL